MQLNILVLLDYYISHIIDTHMVIFEISKFGTDLGEQASFKKHLLHSKAEKVSEWYQINRNYVICPLWIIPLVTN